MSARLRSLVFATLVALLPVSAAAQSIVGALATPSPFGPGATITVTATLAPGASPESWCSPYDNCHIVGMQPLLQVVGSNGFVAFREDWYAQWHDPGPGQTMQPVTYTVYGSVYWTVCWGFAGNCFDYYSYAESGSTQTGAVPAVVPVAEGVTPSSGAGPSQTFTFTYSSSAGATDVYGTVQLIQAPGGGPMCLTSVVRETATIYLWNDTGTAVTASAPLGTSVVLEHGQCRVAVAGASQALAGNGLTVVIPFEFTASFSGAKHLIAWASNMAGTNGAPVVLGTWTARARIDSVSPGSAVVGQTVSVTGQGFGTAWGTVTFNQTPAQPTAWTPTSVTVAVPSGATSGPLEVWTAGQASNGVAFTVVTGPEIRGLSPTWGPVDTEVVISGVNFGATKGSSTVKFNTKTAVTSAWNDTSITARVPAGATSGLVVVTRSGMPPSPGVPFTVGAEEVVYYTTDGIGSVRMITTFGQHVVSRHDYLPFGEEWQAGPSHPQPVKFAGKELDPETGTSSSQALNYFGARYLHSATGRFTTPDPIAVMSSRLLDPQTLNRYTYSRNNPVRYVDVFGLFASPNYFCTQDSSTCLSDHQRRILEMSTIDGRSGEDLWNSWRESEQNSFVNQTDGLGAIVFANGKSALDYVTSVTAVKVDRILVSVGSGLHDAIAADLNFTMAPGGLHGEFGDASYKSTYYSQGNIQLSFNRNRTGVDVDHDLFKNPIGHVFGEVLMNKMFDLKTSQDAVRQMLMKNVRIGITPSPDPAFNRP